MTREEEIMQEANTRYSVSHPFIDIAKYSFIEGAQWADKTMIKKACEYIRTHVWEAKDDDNDPIVESVHNITLDDFIKDFKRFMEE